MIGRSRTWKKHHHEFDLMSPLMYGKYEEPWMMGWEKVLWCSWCLFKQWDTFPTCVWYVMVCLYSWLKLKVCFCCWVYHFHTYVNTTPLKRTNQESAWIIWILQWCVAVTTSMITKHIRSHPNIALCVSVYRVIIKQSKTMCVWNTHLPSRNNIVLKVYNVWGPIFPRLAVKIHDERIPE